MRVLAMACCDDQQLTNFWKTELGLQWSQNSESLNRLVMHLPPIPNLMNRDHGVANWPPPGAIICVQCHSLVANPLPPWHNSRGAAPYAEECIGSEVGFGAFNLIYPSLMQPLI